jgi:hypothetical protein
MISVKERLKSIPTGEPPLVWFPSTAERPSLIAAMKKMKVPPQITVLRLRNPPNAPDFLHDPLYHVYPEFRVEVTADPRLIGELQTQCHVDETETDKIPYELKCDATKCIFDVLHGSGIVPKGLNRTSMLLKKVKRVIMHDLDALERRHLQKTDRKNADTAGIASLLGYAQKHAAHLLPAAISLYTVRMNQKTRNALNKTIGLQKQTEEALDAAQRSLTNTEKELQQLAATEKAKLLEQLETLRAANATNGAEMRQVSELVQSVEEASGRVADANRRLLEQVQSQDAELTARLKQHHETLIEQQRRDHDELAEQRRRDSDELTASLRQTRESMRRTGAEAAAAFEESMKAGREGREQLKQTAAALTKEKEQDPGYYEPQRTAAREAARARLKAAKEEKAAKGP